MKPVIVPRLNDAVVIAFVVLGSLSLTGCEAFRLHDEGRLKAAQEAAAAAAQLTEQSGGVFGLMEQNLDSVKATQTALRARTNEHEYDTFKVIAAGLTVDEIAEGLIDVMQERNQIFDRFAALEKEAVDAVNAQLNRQELISQALDEPTDLRGIPDLEKTIERVDKWLEWIDKGLERFQQVQNALESGAGALGDQALADLADDSSADDSSADDSSADDASADDSSADDASADDASADDASADDASADDASADDATEAEIIAGLVDDARAAIDQVEQDPQVVAARKLLNATILETAAAEQARLSELRRHLAEIKRLRDRLTVRDKVSVCNLYLNAVINTYPAAGEQNRQDMEAVWAELLGSGRYDCLSLLGALDEFAAPNQEVSTEVKAQWQDPQLVAFVRAGFKDRGSDVARSTAEFVGALGILLFYERELYEDAILDLAREQHRHSIRLSALNAGQRAQIVHQLAQGLAIYYQGGVKPEEIAQLMLLASQVGGIFFIGSQL